MAAGRYGAAKSGSVELSAPLASAVWVKSRDFGIDFITHHLPQRHGPTLCHSHGDEQDAEQEASGLLHDLLRRDASWVGATKAGWNE